MESYIQDWFSLIFRWLHLITGVAWIGASFYFIWLDNSLEKPPEWKKEKGIKGDLWAIHGGGIYEIAKYQLSPEKMPAQLHWFKWEAYTTWLTGIVLLGIIYYLGADSYLIDKRVADLTQVQAITLGVSFLVLGWFVYDVICRSALSRDNYVIATVLIVISVIFSYCLTHLFSGRGAYIHMGAIIGTVMVGNVYRVIIPSQKALLAAIEKGEKPDPAWAIKAKLRSTHNTYLTLPLLFIMISNHYPFTYTHAYNWLVLLVIVAITALARQYFVLAHKKINKPIILMGAAFSTLILAFVLAPKSSTSISGIHKADSAIPITQVVQVLHKRCSTCHSAKPVDDMFSFPPAGVVLDSAQDMQRWAERIKARAVDSRDMPFLNKTQMTDEERRMVGLWVSNGALLE